MKLNLKNKILGYWFSVGLLALTLITAIVYVASYAGSSMMSWWVFVFLLVGVVGGAALLVLDKFDYFPVACFVLSGASIVVFFAKSFNYILDFIVGIDVTSLAASFVVSAVFLALTLVASIVILCMEQRNS